MTAWQDRPPQSRRQLRLNESGGVHDDGAQGTRSRDSHVDVAESVEPTALDQPTNEPPQDTFARPEWQTPDVNGTAANAETQTAATHQPRSRAEAAIASGRRSQHIFPHAVPADPRDGERQDFRRAVTRGSEVDRSGADRSGAEEHGTVALPGAEPLNYFTQGRSPVPVYGGPSFGINAVTPDEPDSGAAEQEQAENSPGAYRIRDFSPESRRSAFSSTAEPAASGWGASTEATGGSLDYYTQQGSGQQASADEQPIDRAQSEQAAAPSQLEHPHSSHVDGAARADLDSTDIAGKDHAGTDRAPMAPAESATDADAPALETHPEHTVTRRELRAMRESSAAAVTALPPPAAQVPLAATTPLPSAQSWSIDSAEVPALDADPSQLGVSALQQSASAPLRDPVPLRPPAAPVPQSSRELSEAMAEFDALMARGSGAVPLPDAQSEEPPSQIPPFGIAPYSAVPYSAVPDAEVTDASALDAPEPGFTAAAFVAGEPEHGDTVQDDHDGVEFFDALLTGDQTAEGRSAWPVAVESPTSVPFDIPKSAAEAGSFRQSAAAEQGGVAGWPDDAGDAGASGQADEVDHHYVAPTGHWTRQAANDEADGIALSRNVGTISGAVTASHLVISSVPTVNDLLKPFSPTGEIMITGTIDLPRSLGTTGAHPARYDHSDVDTLLEASDREDSNVDSVPVRAIRAVSTHTSSRGLIGTGKPPHSSRLPMILAVSTAAVAAVVVVLFVAGLVLHVF